MAPGMAVFHGDDPIIFPIGKNVHKLFSRLYVKVAKIPGFIAINIEVNAL